jgi:hypothetical protein
MNPKMRPQDSVGAIFCNLNARKTSNSLTKSKRIICNLLAVVACTTKNETKVLKIHKSRNLKSYYCSCINGRQRQATYDQMQGNYK